MKLLKDLSNKNPNTSLNQLLSIKELKWSFIKDNYEIYKSFLPKIDKRFEKFNIETLIKLKMTKEDVSINDIYNDYLSLYNISYEKYLDNTTVYQEIMPAINSDFSKYTEFLSSLQDVIPADTKLAYIENKYLSYNITGDQFITHIEVYKNIWKNTYRDFTDNQWNSLKLLAAKYSNNTISDILQPTAQMLQESPEFYKDLIDQIDPTLIKFKDVLDSIAKIKDIENDSTLSDFINKYLSNDTTLETIQNNLDAYKVLLPIINPDFKNFDNIEDIFKLKVSNNISISELFKDYLSSNITFSTLKENADIYKKILHSIGSEFKTVQDNIDNILKLNIDNDTSIYYLKQFSTITYINIEYNTNIFSYVHNYQENDILNFWKDNPNDNIFETINKMDAYYQSQHMLIDNTSLIAFAGIIFCAFKYFTTGNQIETSPLTNSNYDEFIEFGNLDNQ